MTTDPRLVALVAELQEFEPRISGDDSRVVCRVGQAEFQLMFDDPEGPVRVIYVTGNSHPELLVIRQRLDQSLNALVQRSSSGRYGISITSDAIERPQAIATWFRQAVKSLLNASDEPAFVDSEAKGSGLHAPVNDAKRARSQSVTEAAAPAESSAAKRSRLPLGIIERPGAAFDSQVWSGPDSPIAKRVADKSREALASYRSDPLLVQEHANKELGTAQGGYGRRQIYELVQNAADELLNFSGGMIKVLLTEEALYCANEGSPITGDGVNAILMSDLSVKRGNEIGRFGLGFKLGPGDHGPTSFPEPIRLIPI